MAAKILEQNGSAVDAAITAMLCNGVVHAESSGIGGGGFMLIRSTNGSLHAINFREMAPLAATEDMFHSNSTISRKVCVHVCLRARACVRACVRVCVCVILCAAVFQGGLSIAVPGELRGMEKAHQLFGS